MGEIETLKHNALLKAASTALFDLFADNSVPPAQLRRTLTVLHELIRVQINTLKQEEGGEQH